ncbi:unnamed protein product [Blepharisma stoltei]|uniref:Thioesterase domain-containing protein n=1 Tax=Blepharisma stoltei TaxID=1481888 RepID=A0AAU9IUR0_9CILI|nr:unnamed protein product [Blepharisma stoltei]
MQSRARSLFQIYKTRVLQQNRFDSFFAKNLELKEVSDEGNLVLSLNVTQEVCDYNGNLSNGAMSSIMDTTTGMPLWLLNTEKRMTLGVQLTVSFSGNARIGDEILIKAKCQRFEGDMGYTYGEAYNKDKVIATALHTVYLLGRKVQLGD